MVKINSKTTKAELQTITITLQSELCTVKNERKIALILLAIVASLGLLF